MNKRVLAAAAYDQQKYYFEKDFAALPEAIQGEVRVICVTLAQKLACTFIMGFYEDGEVYFETVKREDDFDFDEIGAELEIKELSRKRKDVLTALTLWYRVFFTEEGAKWKQELLKKDEGLYHI